MTPHLRLLSLFTLTFTVIAVGVLSPASQMTAAAQSGRRLPKSAPAPAPAPEASPEATRPAEKPKPALKLIVGAEQRGFVDGLPSYLSRSVLRACADRLDAAPSVDVHVTQQDVSRGEAIKTAKAEKEAFVVWLELGSDRMRTGREMDISELYIQYVVFAPMTAKVAVNGRTYPQAYGTGRIILNPSRIPGRTNWPYLEHALKEAARAAAERILEELFADIPPSRVPGMTTFLHGRAHQ